MSVDQQFSQWHTPSVWAAAFANHFSSSSWLPVDRLNLRLASTVEVACKQICSSSPAIIIKADRKFVKFVKRRAVFEAYRRIAENEKKCSRLHGNGNKNLLA